MRWKPALCQGVTRQVPEVSQSSRSSAKSSLTSYNLNTEMLTRGKSLASFVCPSAPFLVPTSALVVLGRVPTRNVASFAANFHAGASNKANNDSVAYQGPLGSRPSKKASPLSRHERAKAAVQKNEDVRLEVQLYLRPHSHTPAPSQVPQSPRSWRLRPSLSHVFDDSIEMRR